MIRQSIRLTRIRGIEIGVHYSWFIVLVLITLSLTTLFAEEHPQWLWLAFIGWFLLIMAQESVLQATLRSAAQGADGQGHHGLGLSDGVRPHEPR